MRIWPRGAISIRPKRMIQWGIPLLCFWGLVACEGDGSARPTNAPIIPPTVTITPTASNTPVPTSFLLTPTAVLGQPSWTPRPSDTLVPSRTPAPTLTRIPPSLTPTPFSALQDLGNGRFMLTVLESELNAGLAPDPFEPHFTIDLDGLRLNLSIVNTLLNQTSQIRAEVYLEIRPTGAIIIVLNQYRTEGPAVTRAQVESAIESLIPDVDQAIRHYWPAGETLHYESIRLGAGQLILEVTTNE